MNRYLALMLTLLICLALVGCNASSNTTTTSPSTLPAESAHEIPGTDDVSANDTTEAEYSITYKGVTVMLNAPAEPIISALGDPVSYTESTSCAFDGLDKTYYYGSLYIDTYPLGDSDYIYDFWFADDTISTPEGICIGAAAADVEAAYGSEYFNGDSAYLIPHMNGTLTIIIKDGFVSSIQYVSNIS